MLYTGVTTPVGYRNATGDREYEVLGVVEGRSSASSILGIVATGDASVYQAYQAALSQIPEAEALVDIAIDQTQSGFLGLFATYTTTVRARAVRWIASSSSRTPVAARTPGPSRRPQQARITIPIFQGTPGHSFALGRSSFNGHNEGSGFRFGYAMRRSGPVVTFTPAISIGSLTKKIQRTDFRAEYERRTIQRMIPIELNITANAAAAPTLSQSLPEGLNLYAEIGPTYYIWGFKVKQSGELRYETDTDWDYFEMGLNLGLGAEYSVGSRLTAWIGIKQYFVFTEQGWTPDLDFWNWQIGLSFYPKGGP